MNKALEELYGNFVFKDNAGTKYFFDIEGVSMAGDNEMSYPLVSIRQNRKNATGAEVFKNAVEKIESSRNNIAIVIREYNSVADDAVPISENRIELRKQTNKNNKNKKKQKQANSQVAISNAQQQQMPFFGFGNPETTNNFLGAMNAQMQMLGIQGGLSGVFQQTAGNLSLQERLDDAKQVISELKTDNRQLQENIRILKDKLETAKDEYKKLEYKLMDTQRDSSFMEKSYQKELSMGSLISKAVLGVVSDKLGLVEKFAGFMGVPQGAAAKAATPAQAAAPQPQAAAPKPTFTSVNPATEAQIDEIDEYLASLDKPHMDMVYRIIEYISISDDNLGAVEQYVKQKTKQ